MSKAVRVAIVSDPLVQRGGAERCVEAFAEAFPEAPIFAVLYSPSRGPQSIQSRVRASWLNRIPGATSRHRFLLPFFPNAVESFDLRDFDVILSSHHTAAKGLLRTAQQTHICYCHTPMRALWERSHEELETLPRVLRAPTSMLFRNLRVWDQITVPRVDLFLANSQTTQHRIEKHYGRTSELLHPPIDVERFTPGPGDGDYYLVASRSVAYKRVDLAIAAAAKIGRRVVVVGTAGDRIEKNDRSVQYRGHVSDQELVVLMRGARALLFPQLEDFGMTPLEMNACGRPVIAYGAGGALETVIDGVTGLLVAEQTVDAFAQAIERSERVTFSRSAIRHHAEQFSQARFISALRTIIYNASGENEQKGRLASPLRQPA